MSNFTPNGAGRWCEALKTENFMLTTSLKWLVKWCVRVCVCVRDKMVVCKPSPSHQTMPTLHCQGTLMRSTPASLFCSYCTAALRPFQQENQHRPGNDSSICSPVDHRSAISKGE